MKMKKNLTAVIVGSMAMLNVETALSAPITSASASFDWNSLLIESVSSDAFISGFSTPVTTLNFNSGDSETGSQAVDSNSVLTSSAFDTNLSDLSSANSMALRSMKFTVSCNDSSSCSFNFSIPYSLSATLEDPINSIANSFANAGFSLGITDAGSTTYASEEVFINLYSGNGNNSFGNPSGWLSTSLENVDDGSTFTFWALALTEVNLTETVETANVSAVPLPSTVWLFISAMMVVLGLTRRTSPLSF
ncbi:MAG: hypothetical protein ABL919_01785 [Methylococcales bacterium]|nr:hypothetical protein [Methylococcaceae bacterium]